MLGKYRGWGSIENDVHPVHLFTFYYKLLKINEMGGVHTKKVRKAEEKKLEPRFSKQIEKMGGQCLKFFPIFNTGWPDRFILMPGGFFFMAEIKSEGKELSPKQKARVKRARKLGFTVFVIDDDISLWYSINMIKYKIAG